MSDIPNPALEKIQEAKEKQLTSLVMLRYGGPP
jgi:hypothetical protein